MIKITLAQINPLVGDLSGNSEIIKQACQNAKSQSSDLVLTPELSLWGYPPRDLLLNSTLINKQSSVLDELSKFLKSEGINLYLLVGVAEPTKDQMLPKLFNSIALIDSSGWRIVARKQLLPTYDVFDEKRYFRAAKSPSILDLTFNGQNLRLGITICEDLWVDSFIQKKRQIGTNPIKDLAKENISLLINLSASPFEHNKAYLRHKLVKSASKEIGCPVIYLNQVGGNDELVFDGASFISKTYGEVNVQLSAFKEEIYTWDQSNPHPHNTDQITNPSEQLFRALVLGVNDYARKCGFNKVLLGLSGGIDSALVAVIATAALGAKNVTALMMPSPWSSKGSVIDSIELSKRLGIYTHTVPIDSLIKTFSSSLFLPLGGAPEGIAAENLQSRIRGTLLMAVANQQGQLLLSTGNKSELAVGYCTLYGDMNGGLAVIGDLYKTTVFALCDWLDDLSSKKCRQELHLSTDEGIIGKNIREKPPSAELKPNQLDTDSLPDYFKLDPILKALIEEKQSSEELVKNGHDPLIVSRVQTLLKKSEFKRRQAPPLLKVSPQAFGTGWRIPIATA